MIQFGVEAPAEIPMRSYCPSSTSRISSAVSMWKVGVPMDSAICARRRVLALSRPPTMNTASMAQASSLISAWRFSVESQTVSKTTVSGTRSRIFSTTARYSSRLCVVWATTQAFSMTGRRSASSRLLTTMPRPSE